MNRKRIGGIIFLIVLIGIAGVFYMIQRSTDTEPDVVFEPPSPEVIQKIKDDIAERNAQAIDAASTDTAPAESNTPTVDKPSTMIPPVTEKSEPTQAPQRTETPSENKVSAEVLVSPYGFGPYPEVPEDMPSRELYTSWEEDDPESELLSRVLIKLWTEGERNFRGGSTLNGKVYPHYYDTVYVTYSEYRDAHGKIVRYPSGIRSGPFVRFTRADLLSPNPPPDLRILDLESSGINPYQYLNLPKK